MGVGQARAVGSKVPARPSEGPLPLGLVAFRGWPASAIAFFDGLAADNSKAYWQAHRAVYDADVLDPMVALLADLADEFEEGRIFRPYRDTRFSADKSPYKTAIAATLEQGGTSR